MKNNFMGRFGVGLLFYMLLVTIAGLAFYWLRRSVSEGSPVRFSYVLCGPSLSLFTHMSYFLFVLQSLLLIPWLLLWALRPNTIGVSIIGFALCWFGIGWYMYDLF